MWQPQTAVARHSQQTKLKPFRLLCILADVADENGVIDPAPSQATLAAELECTDRSLRNYLNILLASGELEQTRIGSGPGRPSAYRICLPMPEKSAGKVETKAEGLEERVSTLEIKVEKIGEILSTIETKIDRMVEKVEKKGGNALVELAADDPYSDPEEKTPPTPPENEYLAALWPPAMKFFKDDRRKTAAIFQAQDIFCKVAKIKHPYFDGNRELIRAIERDWWGPLAQILSEAGGDLDQFGRVVGYVVQEADRPDGFTLSSPKSAVNTFRSIVAQMERKSYRPPETRNGTDKGALLQAIRHQVFRQYGQRGYRAAKQGIPAEHWQILDAMGRWENFFRMGDQDFDIAFYQAINSLNGAGQYAN